MSGDPSELRAALRALASLRRARVIALLAPCLGLSLCFTSLTDHVGYGASLVLALLGSLSAALLGAGLAVALRAREPRVSGSALTLAVALGSVAPVALALAVIVSRSLFVSPCAPARGVVSVLLVTLPGVLLAGLVGALLGAGTARRGLGTAMASATPLLFVMWSLGRFYATPTIFAYDPFFGFFPGAIYDEEVPLGATLMSYRAGTLGWILASAALLAGGWDGAALRWSQTARNVLVRPMISLGALAGLGVFLAGPSLGHRHSADDLVEALGAAAWSRRCVVRYDRSIARREALLTAADCDVRVGQLEDFFGVRSPQRVTVFLFADAAQKQQLMGAAHTYIAKPWRAEVYLQYAPFPHPVLKHELAHVVAAAMAPGPLRVSARARLLPVPGLIEGAAVAAAWEGEGDASPHEWSRAMLDAGIAPRVASLTSLGFFAAASSNAYTAAGSFCRWLHATRGAERFRAVYASGDFSSVYGRDLAALERDWHLFLRGIQVDSRIVARARARFFRASIFGRACPFDLQQEEQAASAALAVGALDEAARRYGALAARDPSNLRARVALAVVRARRGDLRGAEALASDTARVAGPAAAQRLRQAIGDAQWRLGASTAARSVFDSLDPGLMRDDEARTHWLKRDALTRGGAVARVLRELLIGRDDLDPSVAAAMAQALDGDPHDPVLRYLSGRQLALNARYSEALARLPDERAALEPTVLAEVIRLRSIAHFHLRRLDESAAGFRRLAADATRPQGLRDEAVDWIDRIRRTRDIR